MSLQDTQQSSKRRASEGSLPQDREGDAQYWREMYWSLHRERMTEAESQLHAFAAESEKREEALKKCIRHLETEVEEEKKKADDTQKKADEMQTTIQSQEEEMDDMKKTITSQRQEIELYQKLTAATLTNIDSTKELACDCVVTNPESKQSTTFRLTGKADTLIKYDPLSKENASLPEFLCSSIEFEATQAPALMQNVLKSMFPDDD